MRTQWSAPTQYTSPHPHLSQDTNRLQRQLSPRPQLKLLAEVGKAVALKHERLKVLRGQRAQQLIRTDGEVQVQECHLLKGMVGRAWQWRTWERRLERGDGCGSVPMEGAIVPGCACLPVGLLSRAG